MRAPDFSLRQLSYFLAAAECESVQQAAQALHVSAPAVSTAIAHLEALLGVQLFRRRHARGLILTEQGSAFAVQCCGILQEAWGWAACKGAANCTGRCASAASPPLRRS